MSLKLYSPTDIAVSIAGIPISPGDFGSEFIRIAYNNDAFSLTVGAGGGATRTRSGDRSATIELTLLYGSAGHGLLSALHSGDLASATGIGPLAIIDVQNGTTTFTARTVWVKKFPDVTFSNEGSEQTWMLETDQLESTLGSNLFQS